MTCTVLSPAHATNNLPSGATVMSFGRSPTVMSRSRLFLSVSIALTLRLPQLLIDPSQPVMQASVPRSRGKSFRGPYLR